MPLHMYYCFQEAANMIPGTLSRILSGSEENQIRASSDLLLDAFEHYNVFSTIIRGCLLLQQYVVYQFLKLDSEHMPYLYKGQISHRVEKYIGLLDQLGAPGKEKYELTSLWVGHLLKVPSRTGQG